MTDVKIRDRMEIFNEVKFGLEFETCVHILNNPVFKASNDKKTFVERRRNALITFYSCLKKRVGKGINMKLVLDPEQRNMEYDRWVVMPDITLECNKNEKYCVLRRKKVPFHECKDLYFYPIEFITPALTGKAGLKYLTFFWESFIMADDMVYSVNNSHELHTNVSHPEMDVEKFIKLWLYYEPVILQFMEESQRKSKFFTPLSERYKKLGKEYPNIVSLANGKFLAMNLRTVPSPRIEITLHEGSMDFHEIIGWTIFCMWFVVLSITLPEKKLPENYPVLSEKEKILLLQEFFEQVGEKTLIVMLLKKYKNKKSAEWPEFKFSGYVTDSLRNIINLPNDVKEKIKKYRTKTCEDVVFSVLLEQDWKDENGKYHRDGDLPAFVRPNVQKWFRHGELHRENDKPAIVNRNGHKEWWVNGTLHRDAVGPDGKLLPAVIHANGKREYWLNGEEQ